VIRRPQPERDGLTLSPVTPASYLAGRAALGRRTPTDEADLDALTEADLLAFVDAVTEDAPRSYADPDALRSVADAVYAAWASALDTHHARAEARADAACEAMNWWPDKREDDYTPLPEEMPANYKERWPDWRSLPLWEVLLAGRVAAAHAARERVLKPLREGMGTN
jgi:hypothetical protein